MQTIVFLALALSAQAVYANWFKAVCGSALEKIVPLDFSDHEHLGTDELITQFQRLSIRCAWNKADQDDVAMKDYIRRQLELRLQYLSDALEVEKILKVLKEVKA